MQHYRAAYIYPVTLLCIYVFALCNTAVECQQCLMHYGHPIDPVVAGCMASSSYIELHICGVGRVTSPLLIVDL